MWSYRFSDKIGGVFGRPGSAGCAGDEYCDPNEGLQSMKKDVAFVGLSRRRKLCGKGPGTLLTSRYAIPKIQ